MDGRHEPLPLLRPAHLVLAVGGLVRRLADMDRAMARRLSPECDPMIHDADKVIGRITNDGYWDRRYRVRYEERPIRLPEYDVWRKVVEIIALTVYCLILFGSVLFLAAYFAVWMPVEVMAPR